MSDTCSRKDNKSTGYAGDNMLMYAGCTVYCWRSDGPHTTSEMKLRSRRRVVRPLSCPFLPPQLASLSHFTLDLTTPRNAVSLPTPLSSHRRPCLQIVSASDRVTSFILHIRLFLSQSFGELKRLELEKGGVVWSTPRG